MSTFAVSLTVEFEADTPEEAARCMSAELEHEDFDPYLCNYEVREVVANPGPAVYLSELFTGNGDPV